MLLTQHQRLANTNAYLKKYKVNVAQTFRRNYARIYCTIKSELFVAHSFFVDFLLSVKQNLFRMVKISFYECMKYIFEYQMCSKLP